MKGSRTTREFDVVDLATPAIERGLDLHDLHEFEQSEAWLFGPVRETWFPGRSAVPSRLDPDTRFDRLRTAWSALAEARIAIDDRFDSSPELRVALVSGLGGASGHAFLSEGRPVVWIDTDALRSPDFARIFVLHEILHGLHYGFVPELDCRGPESISDNLRTLLVEGLATLATRDLLGTSLEDALWADVLPTRRRAEWMDECQADRGILARAILDGDEGPFFYGGADAPPVINRGGYWLGATLLDARDEDPVDALVEADQDWRARLASELRPLAQDLDPS